MKICEQLEVLTQELNRTHPSGLFDYKQWQRDVDGGIDFVTAENGYQRHFTKKARKVTQNVASIIHENDLVISSKIELPNFIKITKQSLADLHAEEQLNGDAGNALKELINNKLDKIVTEITYYFPAWTLGIEATQPFELGPVKITPREVWLNHVNFSPKTLNEFHGDDWKNHLLNVLSKKDNDNQLPDLARYIYSAIRECPSILSVTIHGYELDMSRKLAEMVCKSALDGISLLVGGGEFFHQQALHDERLLPIESHSLVESRGHLWLPGSKLTPRFRHPKSTEVLSYIKNHQDYLDALSKILTALVNPNNAKYPNLSKRWATALDWAAEAERERSDAIALAKFATSLDVLSKGGKFSGILNMMKNLLKIKNIDEVIIDGYKPLTFKEVIKDIYDNGRSKILHGTEFDRMKSFADSRSYAAFFVRIALIEGALRLHMFSGKEDDKAFMTM